MTSILPLGASLGTFGAGVNAGLGALVGEAGFSGGLSAGFTALGAGNIAGGLTTIEEKAFGNLQKIGKKARFIESFGLSAYDADVLVSEKENAEFFETVAKGRDGKIAANWVMGELTRELNLSGTAITASPVTPERLVELLQLVEKGTISLKVAREIFPELYRSGKSPAQIVQEKGLTQVSDEGALDKIIDEVLAKNPAQVAQFKEGKQQVLGFLVGQVMKASGGKANPGKVNELLKKKFSS